MTDTWQRTSVSADRTHHLLDGVPLYSRRFLEVLKFHAPGLAPVLDATGAYHVRPCGEAAYPVRHRRAFGFYEGLAAVHGSDGWHHIRPGGDPLYPERYGWCGNFQEGRCTVRDTDGSYAHLTADGQPAYPARWRYAGDFRDRMAVVQRTDGLHTHIDQGGEPIHGRWFQDLDVFHKGLARARTRDGWTHVDLRGEPVYPRRFASVEPFYNGQARVETEYGGLEVINGQGATLLVLRHAEQSEFHALSADLVGFWKTQTIAAAVTAGIFEALPGTEEQLSLGVRLAPARTPRLLRALGELGLVRQSWDGVWKSTAKGELLRGDHPQSLKNAACEYAGPLGKRWNALPVALREVAWAPTELFQEVSSDAERIAVHHQMLRSYARFDYAHLVDLIPLEGAREVIDAGGGLAILAGLILERHPELIVTVLERPEVVARISNGAHSGRLQAQAADLFAPWPVVADAVLLVRVLHDWDDPHAFSILRHARAALRPGGRLIVVEMVLEEFGNGGGLSDLHLLVATGGRERTQRVFVRLFDEAGFRLKHVISTPAVPQILVGAPA